MSKKNLLFVLVILIGMAFLTNPVHSKSYKDLEQRLEKLEEKYVGLDQVSKVVERLNLEVEVGIWGAYVDEYDDEDESDIYVDTVEVYMQPVMNDWISGYLEFEYDDDDQDIEAEEARIRIKNMEVTPFYAEFGKFEAIPFGNFETFMIEDSLTEGLGETKEIAGMVGFKKAGFNFQASLYNGDIDETDEEDDHLDNFTLLAEYSYSSDKLSLDFGGSYINNIADAGDIPDLLAGGSVDDYVGGIGVYSILGFQGFTLIGEYITAIDDFEEDELMFDNEGAEPCVWNIELAYTFDLNGRESTLAIGYQGTDEAISLSDIDDTLPKERYTAGFGIEIFDNVSWSIEYMYDQNYDASDFADSGYAQVDYEAVEDESRNIVLTELAFEF